MNLNLTGTPMERFEGPPQTASLSGKELIKEHFYLSKFLQQLGATTNIPTLPDTESLQLLISMNQEL